jgi:hypothetical protein
MDLGKILPSLPASAGDDRNCLVQVTLGGLPAHFLLGLNRRQRLKKVSRQSGEIRPPLRSEQARDGRPPFFNSFTRRPQVFSSRT